MSGVTGAPPPLSPAAIARRSADDAAYLRGVLLVVLAGSFWSLGGILVRLVEAAGAWQIIFYRSAALIPTLALIMAVRHGGGGGRWFLATFRAAGRNGLAAGALQAAASVAFILALQHTTVANTLFMLGGAPFLGALLGWVVLGERVRRATWFAMALAFIGVAVMVGNGVALGTAIGNLYALTAGVCFAGFSVLLRRGRETDMMPCALYAGVFGSLVAALFILLAPELGAPDRSGGGGDGGGFAVTPRDLALCATMGVVQLGMGMTAYVLGARHVPAAELTLLSMVELMLGPIWVWLGVGEVPSPLTLVGGGIIMAAIVFQALSGARRRRSPPGLV
jgi:drug/metabolite transporter, DME family